MNFRDLLVELLELNSITPMETGKLSNAPAVLARYISAAESLGGVLRCIHIPTEDDILPLETPQMVLMRHKEMGASFLENQPSAVIEFGNHDLAAPSLMFNVHIDTVDGYIQPNFDGKKFIGRGAIDAKGLAVSILSAFERLDRDLITSSPVRILLQVVSGEEGGAMGYYGTRSLCRQGFTGNLNVFLEPTRGFYLDECTASMTAAVEVEGEGATDDCSEAGHNATIILAALADHLGHALPSLLEPIKTRMCMAGIHTGTMHNRVYGSGRLLMNFIYSSSEACRTIEEIVTEEFRIGLDRFRARYCDVPEFARTVKDLDRITKLNWWKRGLPALNNRNIHLERTVLRRAGIERFLDRRNASEAFTCDAIWSQKPESYTVVYGEGDLAENHAHADFEFVTVNQLELMTDRIGRMVRAFARQTKEAGMSI